MDIFDTLSQLYHLLSDDMQLLWSIRAAFSVCSKLSVSVALGQSDDERISAEKSACFPRLVSGFLSATRLGMRSGLRGASVCR